MRKIVCHFRLMFAVCIYSGFPFDPQSPSDTRYQDCLSEETMHIFSKYDSRNKSWAASVATSPAFPGRSIEHTDGLDLANPMIFVKKPVVLMENQPAVPLARRPAPRWPPPLLLRHRTWRIYRAACRGSAPCHGLARAPVMAAGQEGGRRTRQIGSPRSLRRAPPPP